MSGTLPIPHYADPYEESTGPESFISYPESLCSLDTVENNNEGTKIEFDLFEDLRRAEIDPDVALRLIAKGKARGSRVALWIRSVIQSAFFTWGTFIQRHAAKILVLGILVLAFSCYNLKNIVVETRLDKLWVEEGGRLEEERDYVERIHGTEVGAAPLIILQTPTSNTSSVLSVEALLLHLKIALLATEVEVEIFKNTWTLRDICHKAAFPTFDERISGTFSVALEHLYPCSIISPLDCFWEGAKLLGPQNPILIPGYTDRVTWASLHPQKLIVTLKQMQNVSFADSEEGGLEQAYFDAQPFITFLNKAGITSGYVEKPCLNPEDVECPDTAPNKHSKKVPDVAEVLSGGCTGISTKFMQWNEEVLLGQLQRNKAHKVTAASAMQTIFHISGARTLYSHWKDELKTHETEWSEEAAAQVIAAWQAKYSAQVETIMNPSGSVTSNSPVMVYYEESLHRLLKDFSEFSLVRIAISYSLVVVYLLFSIKRWSDPVSSFGGVAVAGLLLASLGVAAGISLCILCRIPLNALSSQIVPFLALSLSLHHIVRMVKTLATLSTEEFLTENYCAETLKRNGMYIAVSTICASASFFTAFLIPIPALRSFSLQMGILGALTLPIMLFLFPAVIELDQRRRSARRFDIFCCFGRVKDSTNATQVSYSSPGKISTLNGPFSRPSHTRSSTRNVTPTNRGRRSCTSCPARSGTASSLGPLDKRLVQSGLLPRGMTDNFSVSTDSIFRLDPPTCCTQLETSCQKVNVSDWLTKQYLRAIKSSFIKLVAALTFIFVMGSSAWGIAQIEEGLSMKEFVPKDTTEQRYLDVSEKSFGWYNFHAVTEGDFEYPYHQQLLHDFHRSFQSVENIVRDGNGDLPAYWLSRMRDWLIELDTTLQKELPMEDQSAFNIHTWNMNASDDAILAFKLRTLQTGKDDYELDQVRDVRLVDAKGIINPKAFYFYLSAWVGNDQLAYDACQAMLHPEPKRWSFDRPKDLNFVIPRSLPLDYAQFPFDLHNLHTSSDIIRVVKQIRTISEQFSASRKLPNFPSGTIFLYWEQYLNLTFTLLIALTALLLGFFSVIWIVSASIWSATVMTFMMGVSVIEMAGLIGWLGIQMNAILAVILVFSTGFGNLFSIQIGLSFATFIGSRNRRLQCSLFRGLWPVLHATIACLLGLSMLAFTRFDFVFQYFFLILTGVILVSLLNSLVFLPVLLSLLGPLPDLILNDDSEEVPVLTPEPPAYNTSDRSAAYRVSLSTISEEDAISCQQVFLEPQIILETTTTTHPSSGSLSYNGTTSGSDAAPSSGSSTSTKTVVSARAQVMLEVHRGGSHPRSSNSQNQTVV